MAAPGRRALETVLFVDVVDSTRQLSEHGDRAWARVLDRLDEATRAGVEHHGGRVIKTTGDGSLAVLPGPTPAVACAAALHGAAAELGIELRAGIHVGELEWRDDDVAGIAVHIAARLITAAAPRETLLSETAASLAAGSGIAVEPRGVRRFKGVPAPMVVLAVPPAPSATASAGASPSQGGPTAAGVASLLDAARTEDAAALAHDVDDVVAVAGAVWRASPRAGFLDVDLGLVRLLEETLERLPPTELVWRARVGAKLAFELRGDPTSYARRQELLDASLRDAEAASDTAAEVASLLTRVHSLWEPGGAPERLVSSERAIELARSCRDLETELEARLVRLSSLVEVGRIGDAELELATYTRLSEPLDRADLRAQVASRRAFLAGVHGRLDDSLRWAGEAHRHAVDAGMPDADRLAEALRVTVIRERAGEEGFAFEQPIGMLRELVDRIPGNYFEATLAYALWLQGQREEATVELARALPSLLGSTGFRWLASACGAAEVAADVGDEEVCRRLYDALLPYQDLLCVLGPTFCGAVHQLLGPLALRLGRLDAAAAHLEAAIAKLDGMAALGWAATARAALARARRAAGDERAAMALERDARSTARALGMSRLLGSLPAEDDRPAADVWLLVADDGGWTLSAGGEHAHLRPSRGLEHLRALVSQPGVEVSAADLERGEALGPASRGSAALDDTAKAQYRRRLQALEADLDAADARGDRARAEAIEAERAALVAELRHATGLGGRDRRVLDDVERARVNVTRSIRRAIQQIARAAPLAAAHLDASIRTGTHCRYAPAPGGPERWQV